MILIFISTKLYNNFISKIEDRLSQIRLAVIVSKVGNSFSDPSDALVFYSKVLSVSRERLGKEAALCIDMDVVIVKLKLGETKEANDLLDSSKEILSTIKSSETLAFSSYYGALLVYYDVSSLFFN